MLLNEVFKVIAITHATFFFGVASVVAYHSIVTNRAKIEHEKYGLIMFLGIILIVCAVTITLYRAPYTPFDIWYALCLVGLFCIDFSLIKIFIQRLKEGNPN